MCQDALARAGRVSRLVTIHGKHVPANPENRFDALANGCQMRVGA